MGVAHVPSHNSEAYLATPSMSLRGCSSKSTTPMQSDSGLPPFSMCSVSVVNAMCCSAIRRIAIRLRIARSRKDEIWSSDRYRFVSWKPASQSRQ